ncbi:unnamed protein product, partial [Rotaria magnacalcarata]
MSEKTVTTLAGALKINLTLTTLDLGNNEISYIGAGALADALKVNQNLSTLDLRENGI